MPNATISIPTVHPNTLALANRLLARSDGDVLVAEAKALAMAMLHINGELDQLESQLNTVLTPGMKIGEVRTSIQST